MNAEKLHAITDESFSPPVRRLGPKPSHRDCTCPLSWMSVAGLTDEGVAVTVDSQTIARGTERDHITQQVQSIDGSGGIASYEEFGVVSQEGNFARSLAIVCLQIGVKILPDGNLQEPLFILQDTEPHFRVSENELPTTLF